VCGNWRLKRDFAATHFLMKTLPRVAAEMALHVLVYNFTRVMNIMGVQPLVAGDEGIVVADRRRLLRYYRMEFQPIHLGGACLPFSSPSQPLQLRPPRCES
jgi:hypothetical protein